jgi:outer membrane protein assembly factor BamE
MRARLCAIAVVTSVALMLGGCNWFPSLGVYKLDVNQGNYLTQDQVDRLRVGMTPQQVKLALGTPLLNDPFHASRWDYIYVFERQGRVLEDRKFSVYFVDDKLARWEGDEVPPPLVETARAGTGDARLDKSLSTAPKTDEENWLVAWLKKMGWWGQ